METPCGAWALTPAQSSPLQAHGPFTLGSNRQDLWSGALEITGKVPEVLPHTLLLLDSRFWWARALLGGGSGRRHGGGHAARCVAALAGGTGLLG